MLNNFRALFPEEKDQEISVLWEIVAAMTSDLRRQSASDKWRSAPQVCKVHMHGFPTHVYLNGACASRA